MARPPKGMFRRRSRGKVIDGWYAYVKCDESPQGRRRVSLGSDFDEAVQRFYEVRRRGRPLWRLTVKQAAQEWLRVYVKTHREGKNSSYIESRIKRYWNPVLGHKLVARLTHHDCERFRAWVQSHDIARTTVRHILGDFRSFLLWCEGGAFDRAPIPKGFLPEVEEQIPDPLAEEEVDLLTSIPDPWGFVCRLALSTGMRWGELCRAQASDIRVATGRDGQKYRVLVIPKTKGKRVVRIPLTGTIVDELRDRIGRLVPYSESSYGSFASTVMRKTDALARERSGDPEAVGVRGFHVHRLRHTFACRFVDAGGSLEVLQKLLGHSSIKTTQRYGRLSDSAVRDEVLRVGLMPQLMPRELQR